MDDIEEINPSVMDCSQKELAFIKIKYPGSEDFIKNKIDFSKFLNLKAKLVGPENLGAAIDLIGEVDSLNSWKKHFTVPQIRKLEFEKVD